METEDKMISSWTMVNNGDEINPNDLDSIWIGWRKNIWTGANMSK